MPANDERHTPGPWKAVEAPYNPKGWLWVQNGPGALLADVHQNKNIPLDARNANARLMAAAPDLLEACKAVLAAHPMPHGINERRGVMAVVETAVAKALGND